MLGYGVVPIALLGMLVCKFLPLLRTWTTAERTQLCRLVVDLTTAHDKGLSSSLVVVVVEHVHWLRLN
jgi:hypothetical protein